MSRLSVYVAHPLGAGPDRDANLRNGALWCAWLAEHFDIAPQAPWVVLASVWDESPENRKRGIECDLATLDVCAELWLVGPRVSPGMLVEATYMHGLSKPVRDLTGYVPALLAEPPTEAFRVRATELRWHP